MIEDLDTLRHPTAGVDLEHAAPRVSPGLDAAPLPHILDYGAASGSAVPTAPAYEHANASLHQLRMRASAASSAAAQQAQLHSTLVMAARGVYDS